MYDIAVIGLGPAGATFARTIDKKFKVICFDKKNHSDKSFKKPCGGLLAPDASKMLSKFNISLPKDILVDPQLFSVKTIDLNSKLIRNYSRNYINMDRHKFDMWLISLIPDYITIKDNSICKNIVKKNNYYEVTYSQNKVEYTIKAKYIVGADGANSIVRKKIFPNHKVRTYLSIQQWFKDEHKEKFYSCIFDNSLTNSYSWGLTKDEYFILGGAFEIDKAKNNFNRLKNKLKYYGFKIDKPIRTEACQVLLPSKLSDFHSGNETVFLIGESAGFISPSSFEGISYAFESGFKLSNSFSKPHKKIHKAYKASIVKLKFKLLLKFVKKPFMYNRFLRNIVMRSRLTSVKMLNK